MTSSLIATVVILTVLFLVLSSLGLGLYYLLSDPKGSKRTFKALSIRVSLAMLLFLGLVIAVYFGWITPNPPPL